MAEAGMVMYEEEFRLIDAELSKLHKQINSKVIFLVDKNGQLIASVGDTSNIDTTSLASLTAGNIAATGGIANILGEKEFTVLFHEGENDNVHITIISQRIILVVIFDKKSSLGLVRLRVKKTSEVLAQIFLKIMQKVEGENSIIDNSDFLEITEDDIDKLFS